MKKTVFITFLMLIFNSSFMMALDIAALDPLKENEILRLDYQKRVLNIEKISDKGTEIYYTCKSEWGAWQISSDKRKVLIYENGMHDLYLLDGNDGTITYKGQFNHSAFPSADFKYCITYMYVPEDRRVVPYYIKTFVSFGIFLGFVKMCLVLVIGVCNVVLAKYL